MDKIHNFNTTANDFEPTREDLKEKVRERFARYGRATTALILEFAKRPNWLFEMFEKGGIPYAGKLEAQLANLERHLARHPDPEAFAEFLRGEMALHLRPVSRDPVVAPPRVRGFGGEVPMLGADPTQDLLPLRPATPIPSRMPEPEPAPKPSQETSPAIAFAEPTAGAARTEEPAESAPEPEQETAQIIDVPGYRGPERRRGPVDRRSFRERRGRVDAIGKNRRFGSDRRKAPLGRREMFKKSA